MMKCPFLLAACALLSCSNGSQPPEVPSASPRPFAAFRESSLVIDRLETPIEPPYAVGSTPSSDILSSSDPAVVAIAPFGKLVAHRNGKAIVRSNTGAVLSVTVNVVSSLRLIPDHLELSSGDHVTVKAMGDERELDLSAARWEATNPNIAVATGSTVYAGFTPGSATLMLRSGNASATLPVRVRAAQFTLRIRATNAKLKAGDIERMSVDAPPGLAVAWSSSNPRVLEKLRDGVYHAKRRGIADACVAAAGQTACTRIVVR